MFQVKKVPRYAFSVSIVIRARIIASFFSASDVLPNCSTMLHCKYLPVVK